MKKFIAPLLVGAALTSGFASDDLKKEIEALKAQMAEREQSNETVIDMAAQHEFDVAAFIAQIDSMNTLEELKALAQTIPSKFMATYAI